MKFLVFCAFFCILHVLCAAVTITPTYTNPSREALIYQIKKPLVLTCNVAGEDSGSTVDVEWQKDNKLVSEVDTLNNRFKTDKQGSVYTLSIKDSQNNDAGNWTCSVVVNGQQQASANIYVVTTIAVKIKTENINVVEEEKLRIECSVLGNPYPDLEWKIDTNNFKNETFNASGDRVIIDNYDDDSGKTVVNGVLIIEKINKEDRGLYYCTATNKYSEDDRQVSVSMIRIKDKYAALWPFLGICAEVIVLCAVIIIYEKKRNKTELEESDTDQSPDQSTKKS